MENNPISMGLIIRELRKGKSLTQEALAQAMGVSVQAVSKWENGQSLPDVALLPAIADFFSVSIDVLFGRSAATPDDNPSPDPVCETACPNDAASRSVRPSAPSHPGAEISSAFSEASSALGSMLSGLFRNRRVRNADVAQINAFFSDQLPDDDTLRVVQLQGRRILAVDESANGQVIRLALERFTGALNVEIYGSADIHGSVNGNASAGDAMRCGDVSGNVTAGDGITCNSICGNAMAGDDLSCGSISGNATAGEEIHVNGEVGGNVSAGSEVTCGDVMGDIVRAETVHCRSVQRRRRPEQPFGASAAPDNVDASDLPDFASLDLCPDVLNVIQVLNGKVLSCEESRGQRAIRLNPEDASCDRIDIHGDAIIEGDVEGEINAKGNVACGDVEGDVSAKGSVACGDVDGDVRIEAEGNASLACGDICGTLTAKNASVSCGDIDGDASVEGGTLQYGSVSGALRVHHCDLSCAQE